MAALNYPLYGDTRYIPVRGLLDCEDEPRIDAFGPEPKSRVGLHCHQLTIPGHTLSSQGEAPIVLRASAPWWSAHNQSI